ncbi:hypothetical protein BG910_04860 [Neisseria chenwenguii]|uniref:Large polyvalent protein-associated domain-containing protein n=1 Tax=Neisseria chenwenguii TaxID=1853278 RepID=A0A220S138_9NEIS|nr:hypothetical protein [Neisseria chenwenguii]ASK27157.1 hypothetical protein BG910_04860 [Neisseria chenwenguii]
MEKEHDKDKPAGSRRMEILQRSLANKQAAFDERLQAHFDDVKSANGQPLNDKRNGQATMNRWERQNDGLRSMQESIEKTQRAIEREQHKIDKVAGTKIPEYLKPLLESGEISQWRKYPNRFFVKGVEKARIIWFEDKQEFGYSHIQGIPPEQRLLFKETYGKIRALHRQENSLEPVKPAGSRMEILQQSPADKQAANTDSPSENLKANGYGSFLPLPDFGLQGQDLKAFKASWLRAVESLPAAIEKQRERLAAAGIDDTGLTEYGRETDSGRRSGITTEMTQQRLADITRHIERLRDGQIKPSDYIGSGYKNPRQTAFEAMARDLAEAQAVLSPHIPYCDDINVNNYLRRQLEAERQEPQRPSEKHYSEKIIDSAQRSPEAAAVALEVLPAPHLCTSERFAEYARVVPSDTARRWEVRRPEAAEYGMNRAFSDAATPEGAVKDVHHRTVNNRLYLAAGNGAEEPDKSRLPPENVLAEYPELSTLYMPKSLSERLQTAKQEYERLLAGGNDTDRKLGRFMESGMEALAKGLPEQTQLQVRVNFYENLISRINGKGEPERTPEQQELFAER